MDSLGNFRNRTDDQVVVENVKKFIIATGGILKRDPDVALENDFLRAVLFMLVSANVTVEFESSNKNLSTFKS